MYNQISKSQATHQQEETTVLHNKNLVVSIVDLANRNKYDINHFAVQEIIDKTLKDNNLYVLQEEEVSTVVDEEGFILNFGFMGVINLDYKLTGVALYLETRDKKDLKILHLISFEGGSN